MATTPQTPAPPASSKPPPLTREQVDNPNVSVTKKGGGSLPADGPPKMSTQETLQQRAKEQAEAFQRADDAAYKRATEGVGDDEDLRDKILALGGDITRASPAREQPLPDAVPGLTTTTGAYRTPIDPTTAAVPALEESEMVVKRKGFPTVGSGREGGQPEKLFATREDLLAE
jgi:hypothetical protein